MDLTRRDFVAAAAVTAACAVCSSTASAAPDDPGPAPLPDTTFDAGPVKDLKEGPNMEHSRTNETIIVKNGNKVFAETSICSHKKCHVKPDPSGDHFKCPCHPSQYSFDGKVLHGPAKVALVHYGVSIKGGNLIVDKTKTFDDTKYDAEGASVSIA
jgi:cytochrome b6-f complex iron-sulfur subunit